MFAPLTTKTSVPHPASSTPHLESCILHPSSHPSPVTSDFLVIGSGVAGLSFAIKAAEHGSVTVITKNKAHNSNTAWAQGGISAVLPEGLRDEGDTVEKHVADTLDAGAGLCKEDAPIAATSRWLKSAPR